ncbi:unnamed protein product [Protopolystoma xenopodis]|uniref:Uncharacterized protein n=1 Tax=Protopolystoma xenopodis TaxID=117903 RepID=A0A3S5CLX1_9PLAT|nr:unnamed protein product [Protopolystoma xenopodis]
MHTFHLHISLYTERILSGGPANVAHCNQAAHGLGVGSSASSDDLFTIPFSPTNPFHSAAVNAAAVLNNAPPSPSCSSLASSALATISTGQIRQTTAASALAAIQASEEKKLGKLGPHHVHGLSTFCNGACCRPCLSLARQLSLRQIK